jgi:hypothetical protein
MGEVILRPREQGLERRKETAGLALGRPEWSLRQIQKAIGVRRETISVYLRAAGIAMRAPRGQYLPAKPASLDEVITDFGEVSAAEAEPTLDPPPGRSPSSSACIPYRDVIELGLSRGRNAMAIWQELVDTCGFASGYQSVRRFVSRLQGGQSLEPCAVIETRRAKKRKAITATARWSAIRRAASIGEHDCLC